LQQSLSSLDFTLAPEWVAPLDVVSESARPFPYYMFADGHQREFMDKSQSPTNPRPIPRQ
jgi:hypothetical protein